MLKYVFVAVLLTHNIITKCVSNQLWQIWMRIYLLHLNRGLLTLLIVKVNMLNILTRCVLRWLIQLLFSRTNIYVRIGNKVTDRLWVLLWASIAPLNIKLVLVLFWYTVDDHSLKPNQVLYNWQIQQYLSFFWCNSVVKISRIL